MNIKESSSYIKGLLEGVQLDASKPEGKLISALSDVIEKMAEEIETIKEKLETCSDYIEEIDEDLGTVEELIYDEMDECDCCDDEECDCCCDDCDGDGEFYCALCPSCGEKIYFDESCDPKNVVCPSCQAPLCDDNEKETEE